MNKAWRPISNYEWSRQIWLFASIWFAMAILAPWLHAQTDLAGDSAKLFRQAMETGRHVNEFKKISHEVFPTTDGKSFWVIRKNDAKPKKWIVSLHGAGMPAKGFATDDMAVWYPHLKDRDVGLLTLQWWMGTGDLTRDFYGPRDIYREIDRALQKLNVEPGNVMLHGFSRGAANSYAVAALDAGRGKRYFSTIVVSSGGMSADYPPNKAILQGEFGERPLKGTRWITVAGARDPNPDRDGISAMRRTAKWLEEQEAVVITAIEDTSHGHGAFHLNPKNVSKVLDLFLETGQAIEPNKREQIDQPKPSVRNK